MSTDPEPTAVTQRREEQAGGGAHFARPAGGGAHFARPAAAPALAVDEPCRGRHFFRATPGSARHALDALVAELDLISPQPSSGDHFRKAPAGVESDRPGPAAGGRVGELAPAEPAAGEHPMYLSGRARPRRRTGRRVASVAVIAGGAAVAAGFGAPQAFAYFTSHGSGTSEPVPTGQVTAASVTGVSGVADLVPGGTGAVHFTIHNPDASDITFDAVTSASVTWSSDRGCPSSVLTVVPTTFPYSLGGGVDVPARQSTGPESIPNFVRLSADAPDDCQGASFRITLTMTGDLDREGGDLDR